MIFKVRNLRVEEDIDRLSRLIPDLEDIELPQEIVARREGNDPDPAARHATRGVLAFGLGELRAALLAEPHRLLPIAAIERPPVLTVWFRVELAPLKLPELAGSLVVFQEFRIIGGQPQSFAYHAVKRPRHLGFQA